MLKSGFFNDLRTAFDGLDLTDEFRIHREGSGLLIDVERALSSNILISKDNDGHEMRIPCQNFMTFFLSEKPVQIVEADPSIKASFFSNLKGEGAEEVDRLADYIKSLDNIYSQAKKEFYAPVLNICQSSGSGKSKVALELMAKFPSIYVVFRGTRDSGYPRSSSLSQLFLLSNFGTSTLNDSESTHIFAKTTIVGLYLILLRSILREYITFLETHRKEEVLTHVFKQVATGIMSDPEIIARFNTYLRDCNDTIGVVVSHCRDCLQRIYSEFEDPFVFIFDEATFLAELKSETKDQLGSITDRFRLLRRAFNRIGFAQHVMALTLGTNSDISDLNPSVSSISFREFSGELLFPPFVLANNWDILAQSAEFDKIKISQDVLLSGRLLIVLFSMGRPIWSSISFDSVVLIALTKLRNHSVDTGESFLAAWMIRAGVTVHPSHIIAKRLVKSVLATVLAISPDQRSLCIYYPSEPVLAMAARELIAETSTTNNRLVYYEQLRNFIEMRAIDAGRFAEIISVDICLTAIDKSTSLACNWSRTNNLPNMCSNNKFVLEREINPGKTIQRINIENEISNSFTESVLSKYYKVISVESFLQRLYGSEVFEQLKFTVPGIVLSGFVNATHFVQLNQDTLPEIPNVDAEDNEKDRHLENLRGSTFSCADSRYVGETYPCNVICHELLETGLLRQSGFIMPANYYGIDLIIPVCLNVTSAKRNAAVLSYIGIQVKKGKCTEVKLAVSKGAVSNHFVKCPRHQNCVDVNCGTLTDNDSLKEIYQNQLMLLFCMESATSSSQSQDRKTYSVTHSVDCKVPVELEETLGIKKAEKNVSRKRGRRGVGGDFEASATVVSSESEYESESEIFEMSELILDLPSEAGTSSEVVSSKTSTSTSTSTTTIPISSSDPKFFQYFETLIPSNSGLKSRLKPGIKIRFMKSEKLEDPNKPVHTDDSKVRVRFDPDAMVVSRFNGRNINVYTMLKREHHQAPTADTIHNLTCIKSNNMEVFTSLLGHNVLNAARNIVHFDRTFFDGIDSANLKDTFDSFVSRNNDARMPIADNFLRKKLGLELIPRKLRDYSKLTAIEITDSYVRSRKISPPHRL